MQGQTKAFKHLVDFAHQILITSHISPDPDALSSVLLMGTTLQTNFPDKKIMMVLEEKPLGLDFINGYRQIEFRPILSAIQSSPPELLVLLDANNFSRVSRESEEDIRQYVHRHDVKIAAIDHHEPGDREDTDIYINQASPATVQDVYEICFDWLKFDKPAGYAKTTMLGLYADTNGFSYKNSRHTDTFKLADELVSAGADIEAINNQINQYSMDDMKVFAELASNINQAQDYSYSYISDEFILDWLKSGKSAAQLHKGTESFLNNFIRNIDGRKWGYIVYKNMLSGDNIYSVSFRAVGETKDVSVLARRLGGGGHKPAAGGKFEAGFVKEALSIVQRVVN